MTHAGNLSFALPGGWSDMSRYQFLSADEEFSLEMDPGAPGPGGGLAGEIDRYLAFVQEMGSASLRECGTVAVTGRESVFARLELELGGGTPQIVRLLLIPESPVRYLRVSLRGPLSRETEHETLWNRILPSLRLAEDDR